MRDYVITIGPTLDALGISHTGGSSITLPACEWHTAGVAHLEGLRKAVGIPDAPSAEYTREFTFMKLQLKATRAEEQVRQLSRKLASAEEQTKQLSYEVMSLREALAKHDAHIRRIYDAVTPAVTDTYRPIEAAMGEKRTQPDRAEDGKPADIPGLHFNG